MSNHTAGITNASIRDSILNQCFSNAGLAIHGSNTENVLTAAAVEHCVNGIHQTDFAIDAEVDLSALSVLDRHGNAASLVTAPAIAAGGDSVTKTYILACSGNTAYIIEPEADSNVAGQDNQLDELHCPAGYAPFGAIKIVRAAGAAAFTLGTTALDATGVTSTFSDLCVCPANVSDLN